MAYELFKRKLTQEEYFLNWDSENYDRLTEELRQRIYSKFLIKSEVFTRDNFACLNSECQFPDSPLTLHHVKFQRNGGKDSARNCITLCQTCHKGFHRGKRDIVIAASDVLPSHLSGQTFRESVDTSINWKKVKAEMKGFRKTLHNERMYLSIDDLALLMKFLETIYDYDGEDD